MLKAHYSTNLCEAGIDEAGRGCFAGPVFAAAVIFEKDYKNPDLDDSKKLSAKHRDELRILIEKDALAFKVAMANVEEIDEINILNATYVAMNKAAKGLKQRPDLLLIDGNRFKNSTGIKYKCIVKGDQQYLSIAAASILAKTYRDEYMLKIHKKFPHYGWFTNKGYPTQAHKASIAVHGITKHHRKSFNLNEQLKLFQ